MGLKKEHGLGVTRAWWGWRAGVRTRVLLHSQVGEPGKEGNQLGGAEPP